MFGFFKKKTNSDKAGTADNGLKSWHYSPDENKMVPCESTPCRMHGDTDILATDAYDATIKLNDKINAYKQKQAKNQGMQAGANNAGNLNPNKIIPTYYKKIDLFKDNEYAELVSFNTIYVGNLRYAPAVKKINDVTGSDFTVNFAKRCENCHGTGIVDKKPCVQCGGEKYSAWCSASPADMVLIQDEKDNDDTKFHDFVKKYPDDFNDYMRHVIIANTYLANDGEKALYSQELKKNFKNEVVKDWPAFLRRMRSLKYNYDEMMKGKPSHTINGETIMVPAPIDYGIKITNQSLTIVSYHLFDDKKTGEKKAIVYCRNEESGDRHYQSFKIFAPYSKLCAPGNILKLKEGRPVAYEPDNAGRPYLKLANAKVFYDTKR